MTESPMPLPFDEEFAAARSRACKEVAETCLGHCNGTPITLQGFLAFHDNSRETVDCVTHNIAATYDREMLAEWQRMFAPTPLKKSFWDKRPWLRNRRERAVFLGVWALSCIGGGWLALRLMEFLNWTIRSLT